MQHISISSGCILRFYGNKTTLISSDKSTNQINLTNILQLLSESDLSIQILYRTPLFPAELLICEQSLHIFQDPYSTHGKYHACITSFISAYILTKCPHAEQVHVLVRERWREQRERKPLETRRGKSPRAEGEMKETRRVHTNLFDLYDA